MIELNHDKHEYKVDGLLIVTPGETVVTVTNKINTYKTDITNNSFLLNYTWRRPNLFERVLMKIHLLPNSAYVLKSMVDK